jgi:hypothetical protein
VRWAIFYAEPVRHRTGLVSDRFTDADGEPGDACPFGVQLIQEEYENTGRTSVRMHDYYIFRGGAWYGSDRAGLIDSLAHFPGCVVRFGRTLDQATYERIIHRARDDDYLPRKSGNMSKNRHTKGV